MMNPEPQTAARGPVAGLAWLALAVAAQLTQAAVEAQEINPPVGPYVNLRPEHFAEASSFSRTDRIVLTPFFYWYDVYSGAHVIDADGTDALTDHPPTLEGFSFRSQAWHQGELRDMIAAGVQVVLPVYWGEPSQRLPNRPAGDQPWSYAGLLPLVKAREALLQEGLAPPRIGMFYDTSTLEYNAAGERIDLTTPRGQQWFYESIRDFFSLIPPKHWAMIEGQPIVFLYSAAFALEHDQGCIDFLRAAFARDFGGRQPYVVREISWQASTENVYAWGGALGLKNPGVASLGPGYDHSAVPGREPLVVDREDGAFFERNWIRFLRRPSTLVMIETWNEYHEGTEIAASLEYGRKYLELNRRYADMFQQGLRPPMPPGPYSGCKRVSVELQETNVTRGIVQLESADGVTRPAEAGGSPCRAAERTVHAGRYIYFRIDDSYKWADTMLVDLAIEYYDSSGGSFTVEFDGSDLDAPFQGAYTSVNRRVYLEGSMTWRTAQFRLLEARLLNSQNSGADFRIALDADPFYVRRVEVTRPGLPDEAGQTLPCFPQDFSEPLNAHWQSWDTSGALPAPVAGMLQLESVADPFPVLRLAIPGADAPQQEILARVRLSGPPRSAGPYGGVVAGAGATVNQGICFQLGNTSQGSPAVILSDPSVAPVRIAPVSWRPNAWYWLRLRHAPNAIANYPDAVARIWPADGESAEPVTWTVHWDYFPALPARQGWAGLIAPSADAAVKLECDFFLLRTDSLPETMIRLPALKPARAILRPVGLSPTGGLELEVEGSPSQSYYVESSPDFEQWSRAPVTTDPSGLVFYEDPRAATQPQLFYRAWAASADSGRAWGP